MLTEAAIIVRRVGYGGVEGRGDDDRGRIPVAALMRVERAFAFGRAREAHLWPATGDDHGPARVGEPFLT